MYYLHGVRWRRSIEVFLQQVVESVLSVAIPRTRNSEMGAWEGSTRY